MSPMSEFAIELIRVVGPPLITILLGGFILQRFFVSKANQSAFIDLLDNELCDLRSDCLEYWALLAKSSEEKQRAQLLAQKIKGGIKSIGVNIRHYSNRYCKNKYNAFNELVVELSDACTGGDFESSRRKPDNSRPMVIINTISHIRAELFKGKL